MNFDSFEDILVYAIEREKESVAFYKDIAQKAAFSGARETLEGFAREEKKHQVMLEDFDKKKITDYDFKWIPNLKRSDYLVDMEYEESMAYPELLRLAMKREEKSLKLYSDLRENADGKEIQDLFQFLAQEEAGHKLKLETIYDDFMAKQGD
ncbi:MAG: ferritin family protein [Acidobacteria bacterium]|nr:ferritin family protein [Acidobacteriota bacterium]